MVDLSNLETVMLDMLTLPPLPKDFKTDLYIYTIDKDELKTANKFQCQDIEKKDSLFNKNYDAVILVSNKKSKDGKEYVGTKLEDVTNNHIYLAYTEGKTATARIKDYALSLMHFLKCLIDNDVTLTHVGIEENEFAYEVGAAITLLLEDLKKNKKTEL